ncbi:MAG: hypothetical protein LBH25_08430 [Fibromonadaceae bacterium]|nr:hypothetical protein [Fibromonadaceae bacterium]
MANLQKKLTALKKNKYLAGFSNWSDNVSKDVIYSDLEPLVRYEVIELNQFTSIEGFRIGGKSKRDYFYVIIWEMKPSVDMDELHKSIAKFSRILRGEADNYFDKPIQRTFFVFENFIIWANSWSYASRFDVYEELGKIYKKCFE